MNIYPNCCRICGRLCIDHEFTCITCKLKYGDDIEWNYEKCMEIKFGKKDVKFPKVNQKICLLCKNIFFAMHDEMLCPSCKKD